MAFVFSKTTPATGAAAMFDFKEQLKVAGWTVTRSSDGTTYNAAGDQITLATSGAGGMANNSAWFVIQSPVGAGGQQFAIQRGTTNLVWKIKRSRTAGFTGGSPSATQMPSATDEFTILGGGTDASPTFTGMFSVDGGIYRWNVGADNASPYGFWAASFPNGGGATPVTVTSMICDPLTSNEVTDADPNWLVFSTTLTAALTFQQLGSESGSSITYRNTSQIISAAPGSSYAEFTGLNYCYYAGQSLIVIPFAEATNPITGNDEAFPIIVARRAAVATPGYKGITTLLRWIGTARSTGDTLTISTTRDRIIINHVSLPWDGSVPTV